MKIPKTFVTDKEEKLESKVKYFLQKKERILYKDIDDIISSITNNEEKTELEFFGSRIIKEGHAPEGIRGRIGKNGALYLEFYGSYEVGEGYAPNRLSGSISRNGEVDLKFGGQYCVGEGCVPWRLVGWIGTDGKVSLDIYGKYMVGRGYAPKLLRGFITKHGKLSLATNGRYPNNGVFCSIPAGIRISGTFKEEDLGC